MNYVWTLTVVAAAIVIVYRCIAMANAMTARTAHRVRIAVGFVAMLALGEILAPLVGRVPDAAEGWFVIAVGAYFFVDRRRGISRFSDTQNQYDTRTHDFDNANIMARRDQ